MPLLRAPRERGLAPACAIVCPTEAIIPGDFHDPESRVARLRRDEDLTARKLEADTGPNVYYKQAHPARVDPLLAHSAGGYLWANQIPGVQLDAQMFAALEERAEARTVYDVPHLPLWGGKVASYLFTKSLAAGAGLAGVFILPAVWRAELGVATKNGKRATTFLLPIPELLAVAQAWDIVVRSKLQSPAPWYAPIFVHWGGQSLDESEPGKNRHQALDKRLRKLFELAGLRYKSAHKFRHGHAVYGLQHAQTMADYKAVSMNLMHEDIKITYEIYAPILSNEVQVRIGRLAASEPDSMDNSIGSLIRSLSNHDLSAVMRIIAERLAL